jgi:hypothetical protein
MKKIILVLLVALSYTGYAQKFTIQGQLVDTLSRPLPSATVLLLNPRDSSLVNFAVGDVNGKFMIRNVSKGEHLFKVTFIGFRPFTKKIATPETGTLIDLGVVKMEPSSKELDAIEIAAERAPVTVKRDTIEFNAASFKTKQNAMVEDLLKKLPGVEVDNDGNVTAQGEQVRRVTVDGKNFFGNDPKIATKNLPADAVDKVQLFDKKSDQAVFSGIDDGQKEKTINLELKEEKRHGVFGTMVAGIGNDERFQSRANLNKFDKGKQLSFLGMANNVNQQGFSMDDYMNFTGGAQQMASGGGGMRITMGPDNSSGVPLNFGNRANGIMTNYAGGINMNNPFNKKTELNGSYFFNYLDHQRNQTTYRENYFPNQPALIYNQVSKSQNNNTNNRLNLTLDHKIDSLNTLKLTTNVSYNQTESEVTSTSSNVNAEDEVQNEGQRLSVSSGANASLNSNLLWRHRFAKKGRTFSANVQLIAGDNTRDGFLDAVNTTYGNFPGVRIDKQESDQSTFNRTLGGTVSYTEPLGNRKYLEGNYTFRQNVNDVERMVYDLTNDAPEFRDDLSTDYTSDYQYHRAGLNFRMNRQKYNFAVGGSLQSTRLRGDLESNDGVNERTTIDRPYQNVLPNFRFNYDFSTTRHLGFDYETSVQEPNIQQLQPVVDNSDPLNLYVGNPQLRPAYSQSWRLNFNTFNPMNFMSFFMFADVDYSTNAITNAQTQGPSTNFVRTTTPVNVASSMSMMGNIALSFPINKIKSRLSISGNYRGNRSINVLNDVQSTILQQSTGGTIRYNYRYKEIFDISLSGNQNFQITDYEANQQDQLFVNSTYSAEANLTILKNYQLSSTFEYLDYENDATNYRQQIPLLDISLSRFFLKNKTGELKLSASNLLDKALGVNQTASSNYIQRETTNSLGRYFMISFIYSLNKQLNPMGMRRGGGIRIMR